VCLLIAIDRSIGNWYRHCLPVVFDAWHCRIGDRNGQSDKSLIKKILRHSIVRLSAMQILTSRLSQKSLVGPTIASARLPDYPCTIHILPGLYSPVSMSPSLRATLDFVCPAIEVSVLSARPQKRPCATPTPNHLLPGTLRDLPAVFAHFSNGLFLNGLQN